MFKYRINDQRPLPGRKHPVDPNSPPVIAGTRGFTSIPGFFDLDEVVALGRSCLDLVRACCSCIHNKHVIKFPDPGYVPVSAQYNIHTAPVEQFKHIPESTGISSSRPVIGTGIR